jgi:hypothetical protein
LVGVDTFRPRLDVAFQLPSDLRSARFEPDISRYGGARDRAVPQTPGRRLDSPRGIGRGEVRLGSDDPRPTASFEPCGLVSLRDDQLRQLPLIRWPHPSTGRHAVPVRTNSSSGQVATTGSQGSHRRHAPTRRVASSRRAAQANVKDAGEGRRFRRPSFSITTASTSICPARARNVRTRAISRQAPEERRRSESQARRTR